MGSTDPGAMLPLQLSISLKIVSATATTAAAAAAAMAVVAAMAAAVAAAVAVPCNATYTKKYSNFLTGHFFPTIGSFVSSKNNQKRDFFPCFFFVKKVLLVPLSRHHRVCVVLLKSFGSIGN